MTKQDNRPRRQQINETASVPEDNSYGTPQEIPLGGIPKIGLAEEIQQQIAIQMAKKTTGESA